MKVKIENSTLTLDGIKDFIKYLNSLTGSDFYCEIKLSEVVFKDN